MELLNYVSNNFCLLEKSMERDSFMDPVEAKAYGLIDTVLEHPPLPGETEEKSS